MIEPAVRLAREGFALPRDLARSLAARQAAFARHPASAAVFAKDDGTPYGAGKIFRQPDLAASLERVLEHGRAGFYGGETADLIVAEMQRGGGFISHADLTGYRSVWREPIRGTYRGHDIISMPPPSSGGVLLVQMLNMLEPYDIGAMGFGSAAALAPRHRGGAARLRGSGGASWRCGLLSGAGGAIDQQGLCAAAVQRFQSAAGEPIRRGRCGCRAAAGKPGYHPRFGDRQGRQRGRFHHHPQSRLRLQDCGRRNGHPLEQRDG